MGGLVSRHGRLLVKERTGIRLTSSRDSTHPSGQKTGPVLTPNRAYRCVLAGSCPFVLVGNVHAVGAAPMDAFDEQATSTAGREDCGGYPAIFEGQFRRFGTRVEDGANQAD